MDREKSETEKETDRDLWKNGRHRWRRRHMEWKNKKGQKEVCTVRYKCTLITYKRERDGERERDR